MSRCGWHGRETVNSGATDSASLGRFPPHPNGGVPEQPAGITASVELGAPGLDTGARAHLPIVAAITIRSLNWGSNPAEQRRFLTSFGGRWREVSNLSTNVSNCQWTTTEVRTHNPLNQLVPGSSPGGLTNKRI
jgi:hypothetical protein